MFNFLTRVFIVMLACTTLISTQEMGNICSYQLSCKDCIQLNDCAWCSESHTCFSPSSNQEILCRDQFVYNPETSITQLDDLVDETTTESSSWSIFGYTSSKTTSKQEHQLNPQEIKLTMRPNTTFRFNFKFTSNEDFPVDLFYLVDVSEPINDEKQKLFQQLELLPQEMKKITNNFRLGFGTFVGEKFEHHLPLTQDVDSYLQEINGHMSGEDENLQLTYTSIMKSLCDSKWRTMARRIMVVGTTNDCAISITPPSNYSCHYQPNPFGFYSEGSSQLNDLVTQESVNIIFVVKEQNKDACTKLSHKIQGSSVTGLDNNFQLTELIEEEYNKISRSVEVRDNAPDFIKIAYSSTCLNGYQEVQTNTCDGLKNGDTISFFADITVTECPKNENDWNQKIIIRPVGINQKVTIDLNLICDCSCMESKCKI